MKLFHYFDYCRIINLKSRPDRRIDTESEFMKIGAPFNSERVQFFAGIVPESAEGFPNIGVRGCFLSHLEIMKSGAANQSNRILILEDDIMFSKDFLALEESAIKSLDEIEWDILYFGHSLGDERSEKYGWRKLDKPILLAHFYGVNGRIVKQLIMFLSDLQTRPRGHPSGGPMHFDGALNLFRELNPEVKAYYFSKNLGYQRPSMTNLHNLSLIDRINLIKGPVRILRRVKGWLLRKIR